MKKILAGYQKIPHHVLRNDNVAEALNTYITDEQADMLAMFTHKLDFYEKLFGKSVTRQLAFHAQVPLITFNKTTLYELWLQTRESRTSKKVRYTFGWLPLITGKGCL